MSRQQASQSLAPKAKHTPRAHDSAHRLEQAGYLISVKQLAVRLDFITTAPSDPEEACRNWLRRHHVVSVRRGRRILVHQGDIDRALRAI